MKYILYIITVLYGGLSVFASALQFTNPAANKVSAFIMIIGGITLIYTVFCSIKRNDRPYYIIIIMGSILIVISAIWNGLNGNNFHISHHLIRITISAILAIGFFRLSVKRNKRTNNEF